MAAILLKLITPIVINKFILIGNAIINGNNFTIIDWDSPMLSPMERDAWFFIDDDQNLQNINDILASHGIKYKLDDDRLAFYCYYSFFYYLHEYLTCFFELKNDMHEFIVKDLHDYFNCWIVKKLEKVDGLILSS